MNLALRNAQALAGGLKYLAQDIHELNAHFYNSITSGVRIERNPAELLCLVHSEVSEMLEGVRKNINDTHLTHRKMEEVEAADVLMRLLDYCAYRKLDIAGAMREKLAYNVSRRDHTPEARRAEHGKKF